MHFSEEQFPPYRITVEVTERHIHEILDSISEDAKILLEQTLESETTDAALTKIRIAAGFYLLENLRENLTNFLERDALTLFLAEERRTALNFALEAFNLGSPKSLKKLRSFFVDEMRALDKIVIGRRRTKLFGAPPGERPVTVERREKILRAKREFLTLTGATRLERKRFLKYLETKGIGDLSEEQLHDILDRRSRRSRAKHQRVGRSTRT